MGLGSFIAGALLFGGGGRSEHHHHHVAAAPRIDYDALGESAARHIVSCAYEERKKMIWAKLDRLYHEEERMHTICGRCGQDIDLVEFRVHPPINDVSSFDEIPARGNFVFRCGCETKTIEYVFDAHPMIGAPLTHENAMLCQALFGLFDNEIHRATEVTNSKVALGVVFAKAYQEWFTKADEAGEEGMKKMKDERDRLRGMLDEPIPAIMDVKLDGGKK
jgi:hypothetical protein